MKALLQLLLIFSGVSALFAAEPEKTKPIELTTLLGETFHNARIIKATPDTLTVVHDAGVSKVPFDSLNDEWKKMFHYDAVKAKEFRKQEEARQLLAEESRKKSQKEHEDQASKQMAELALRESQRAEFEAKLARQQAESAPKTTVLNSTTEVVVPATTPITQVYTPGYTRGQGAQSTIINEGTIFTPGNGRLFYINPGYYGPIYYTPPYTIPYCPHGANVQPAQQRGMTFQFGNGSFQISR
jgi:hypothetical protein